MRTPLAASGLATSTFCNRMLICGACGTCEILGMREMNHIETSEISEKMQKKV